MKLVCSLVLAALFSGASAYGASFSQCPAVGADTLGCELLITVTGVSGGAATAFTVTTASPDQGPYDGSEDTLIGVLNSSGSVLTSLSLSSSLNIFAFEGDGACSAGFLNCAGADPTGYAPTGVSFSGINAAATSGTVNFSPGIPDGGNGWFSLEDALTASQIGGGGGVGGGAVPEPSSILLMGLGLVGGALAFRRRRLA